MIRKKLIFTCVVALFSLLSFAQGTYDLIQIDLSKYPLSSLQSIGIEMDHVHPHGNQFNHILSASDRELLDKNGIQYETLVQDYAAHRGIELRKQMSSLSRSANRQDYCEDYLTKHGYRGQTHFEFGSMGGFYTYDEMLEELDEMKAAYPRIVTARTEISDIRTFEDRPIYSIKISDRVNINESEPKLLITGMHHSREPASMQQAIYTMWYLLENYGSDPLVTEIVDNTEIYFVPCVNPDGYVYNESTNPDGGGMWRKNRRTLPDGQIGVDLNRNYGYEWGYENNRYTNDVTSDDVYRGPEPFSEAETQAIKYLCETTEFDIAINYHSFGDLLFRPWGYDRQVQVEEDDKRIFDRLLYELTLENRYLSGTGPGLLYSTNGDSDDWMFGERITKNKIHAMTCELGHTNTTNVAGFWPDLDRIESQMQQALIMNLKACRFLLSDVEVEEVSEEAVSDIDFRTRVRLHWLTLDPNPTGNIKFERLSENIAEFPHNRTIEPNVDGFPSLTELNLWSKLKNPDNRAVGEMVDIGMTITEDFNQREIGHELNRVYFPDYLRTDLIASNTSVLRSSNPSANVEGNWSLVIANCYSVPDCLQDSPFGNYGGSERSSIVFDGPISVPDNSIVSLNYKIKWDLKLPSEASTFDYFQALISTDGQTFTPLCGSNTVPNMDAFSEDGEPVFIGLQDQWVLEEIDMTAYSGQEVYIKFELKSNLGGADGVTIDDVFLDAYDTRVSVGEQVNEEHGIAVYPNPAIETLNVRFDQIEDIREVRSIRLANNIGQTVLNSQSISQLNNLNVASLPSGMYVLMIQMESGQLLTQKVIVQ